MNSTHLKPVVQEGDPIVEENHQEVSLYSPNSNEAQQLVHCYKLALDFGVPTAEKAMAIYKTNALRSE